MSITHLPVETLDKIAGFIESPTDLHNFAVSKQLHSIVSPRHTQLRIIRSPLRSTIWQKLITHRSLAQNVRTLEIQRAEDCDWHSNFAILNDKFMALEDTCRRGQRNPPIIPEIFREKSDNEDEQLADLSDSETVGTPGLATAQNDRDTDLCAERLLVLALRNMTGLTSFAWSHTPPFINPDVEDDVWITLLNHCPDLREVLVIDGIDSDYEDNPHYRRAVHNPMVSSILYSNALSNNDKHQVFTFKNLKSFVMATDVGPNAPDMKPFAEMHSPDLEVSFDLIIFEKSFQL